MVKSYGSTYDCTAISAACPVTATTYGYLPNVPANLFFAALFAALLLLCLFLGIRSRIWAYTIALAIGLALELAGYVGRYEMSKNPWDKGPFQLQIVGIILAPSFMAASIYLTLKGLVLHFGPQHSLIKAKLYPIIFVGCDFGSIVLQAIGGGIAAVAGNKKDTKLLHTGNGLIIAGIAFQVFTMTIFGILATAFFIRYKKAGKHQSDSGISSPTGDLEKKKSPTIFCCAIAFAYTTIMIRCIYRYAPLSHSMTDN